MERFLAYVLRHLVEFPDDVVIHKEEHPGKVSFELKLKQSDVPRVVGKHGATIGAIRNLLNAAGGKHGVRVYLDVVEERSPVQRG